MKKLNKFRNWIILVGIMACYIALGDGGMLGVVASVSGIRHSPVRRPHCPVKMICLFLMILTSALSNVASHPASQSLLMETRELCVRLGIIWASQACSGNCESDNWQACVVD